MEITLLKDLCVRVICLQLIKPNGKKIRKISNELAKQIEQDIFDLQWMVSGTVEFCHIFKLLEEKFLCENYTGEKLDLIREFFQYFRNIWGPESHITYWFEGANPYNISHNQGIESKNGCITKDYTFRDRLDTAYFFI